MKIEFIRKNQWPSFNVCPYPASANMAYRSWADIKNSRDFYLSHSFTEKLPDSFYFFVVKLCIWLFNSATQSFRVKPGAASVTSGKSSLFLRIKHVLRMGSKKQVIRTNANFVIAMMAGKKTELDFSNKKHVRSALCMNILSVVAETPVSIGKFPSYPFPTRPKFLSVRRDRAIFLYLFKKTFLNARFSTSVETLIAAIFCALSAWWNHERNPACITKVFGLKIGRVVNSWYELRSLLHRNLFFLCCARSLFQQRAGFVFDTMPKRRSAVNAL